MKFFISLIFLALSQIAIAQSGINGTWQSFRADDWHRFSDLQNGSSTPAAKGYSVGLDYWFRLKEKRVEFLPELNYGRHEVEVEGGTFRHRMLSLFFNINLYPFDFGSDCNCPTWSKTGNFFTKGFYLQLSPGISGMKNSIGKNLGWRDKTIAWAIGAGAGVDIGLSDFLTVTPFFRYHFYPNVIFEGLPEATWTTQSDVESDVKILSGGIRLGLRSKKSR